LPAFNEITIENCLGTIGQQAAAVEKSVKSIEKDIVEKNGKVNPKKMFDELDEVSGPLDTTWGIAKAIYLGNSTLIPTKSYMNIHERARNVRASKFCSKIIYNALEKYNEENEAKTNESSNGEKRMLQKYLLEGKLNGLKLKDDDLVGLRELLIQLGRERAQFKNKVNMSMHTFSHVIKNFDIVRDFPSTLLGAMSKDTNQPLNGPWKLSLQPQIVEGFLKYCPDRNERWNLWQANSRKASHHQDKSLENSTHIEKIRALRNRQANILGKYIVLPLLKELTILFEIINRIFYIC